MPHEVDRVRCWIVLQRQLDSIAFGRTKKRAGDLAVIGPADDGAAFVIGRDTGFLCRQFNFDGLCLGGADLNAS